MWSSPFHLRFPFQSLAQWPFSEVTGGILNNIASFVLNKGSSNSSDFIFDVCILLNGNIQNDIKLIKEILENPLIYYKETYTEKNKHSVNLIENFDNIFS